MKYLRAKHYMRFINLKLSIVKSKNNFGSRNISQKYYDSDKDFVIKNFGWLGKVTRFVDELSETIGAKRYSAMLVEGINKRFCFTIVLLLLHSEKLTTIALDNFEFMFEQKSDSTSLLRNVDTVLNSMCILWAIDEIFHYVSIHVCRRLQRKRLNNGMNKSRSLLYLRPPHSALKSLFAFLFSAATVTFAQLSREPILPE